MKYLVARTTAISVCLLVCSIVAVWHYSENSSSAAAGCGTPSFAVVVTPNVNNSLNAVAMGDLNGDTKPDLVTANEFNNQVTILVGDGTGNFAVSSTMATGTRPSALVLGDFNGDTKLDLAVSFDFSTTVSLYLGTGSATFSGPTNFAVGTNPLRLVAADFNNDGKLDLATGNDGSNTISILLGNGSGGFAPATSIANVRPASLVVADFNHDNKPDLAAANFANNKVTVMLGDGAGGFGPLNHFDGGSSLQGIASADFNNDTNPDIVVTNNECCNPAFVAVLLGNGSGSFGAPTKFSTPLSPFAVVTGDFNGDSNADVATVNVQQTSSNVAVLTGNGAGALSAPTNFNVGATPIRIITGDVNLDNAPDLVVTRPPNVAALLNACGGAPTPTPTATPTPSPTPVASPTPPLGAVVISQIYGGSGQVGSTYKYNYVELFNRTNEVIDIGSWPISAASATGDYGFSIGFVSSRGVFIGGGQYLLIQIGPAGASGAPLPVTPDFIIDQNIELAGRLAFSRAGVFLSGDCPTLPNSSIVDYVGYGSAATCFEGAGPIANLSANTAAVRLSAGCTDTDNNATDFIVSAPGPRNSGSTRNFCSSEPPKVQLTQSLVSTNEGSSLGLVVTRTGNTSGASTVDYSTSDASGANNCNVVNGNASSRCDYIAQIGTLQFAAGETFKVINIPLIDDSYAEGTENFLVTLSNPNGAVVGTLSTATIVINDNESTNGVNPINQTSFFVREQYLDFLDREPDSQGNNFWLGEINNCTPKPQCTEVKRINVSAAFFVSIEFQESGYLAERAYKTAYGDAVGTAMVQNVPTQISVPIIRLNEFLYDSHAIGNGVIVGNPNWQDVLAANKSAYFNAFVTRQRFLNDYPQDMSAADFVNKLNGRAGGVLTQSEQNTLTSQLTLGQKTRAEVFRAIAENGVLKINENSRAFVLMQYFGYLRRNPNDVPDSDYTGYKFWLDKLNQFNGNYIQAEMVASFINSAEYRQRFGT